MSLPDTDMARRGLGRGRKAVAEASAAWLVGLALMVLARARGSSYRGFLRTHLKSQSNRNTVYKEGRPLENFGIQVMHACACIAIPPHQ